jgi:hypothetical protein
LGRIWHPGTVLGKAEMPLEGFDLARKNNLAVCADGGEQTQ